MDSVLQDSIQSSLRPGKRVDIYYPDSETNVVQAFRTTVNQRFTTALTNKGGGTSVFTLPPSNGFQDIVLGLRLPNISANTGLAVGKGWAYSAIKQVSWRVGGSSQYFQTGRGILLNALKSCPDQASRDALITYGGTAKQVAELASDYNYGYAVISVPWCKPTVAGKPVPLPSDCLTSQVQITVELNPLSAIFSSNSGTIPTEYAEAYFQVQQVELANQSDALARRTDLSVHALSLPVNFTQQEVAIPLSASASPQPVTLTGFRSGSVRNICLTIQKASDLAQTLNNPLLLTAPADVEITYAGTVYTRFAGTSSGIWDMINGRGAPQASVNKYTAFGSGAYTSADAVLSWADCPLAQPVDTASYASIYSSGIDVTNGIVNAIVRTPTSASDYTLYAYYDYGAVLVFGAGTADLAM